MAMRTIPGKREFASVSLPLARFTRRIFPSSMIACISKPGRFCPNIRRRRGSNRKSSNFELRYSPIDSTLSPPVKV
jgi:hypothetical protein